MVIEGEWPQKRDERCSVGASAAGGAVSGGVGLLCVNVGVARGSARAGGSLRRLHAESKLLKLPPLR